MESIIIKNEEFATFLNSIDLEKFTRKELKELADRVRAVKMRPLTYEIDQQMEKLKVEEFPELLGVHHFPALRDINFLSEAEKIKLDEFLVRFRVGNYVAGLWQVTENKDEILTKFLIECGIVEEKYFAICPVCEEGHVSGPLTSEEKRILENAFGSPNQSAVLDEILEDNCNDCDETVHVNSLTHLYYKTVYIMAKERDGSLDNV